MKKFLTLLVLAVSFTSLASSHPLKIINNSPYVFDYMMTTTDLSAVIPNYAFPLYRQSNLVSVMPSSSVVFDDPGNPGLPYYLLPGTWDYYPVNWSTSYVVSGTTAYRKDGLNQKWASVKFNLHTAGGFSVMSGHIGPFQGNMLSASNPTYNVTLTWVASGNAVTLIIS